MALAAMPWEPREGGLALRVRVTPRGGRDALEGVETLADGRAVLKARCGSRQRAARRTMRSAGSWPRPRAGRPPS
jgi:hypothetical protein